MAAATMPKAKPARPATKAAANVPMRKTTRAMETAMSMTVMSWPSVGLIEAAWVDAAGQLCVSSVASRHQR